MGKGYSLELGERVATCVGAGSSCRAAARRFVVSDSFAIKLVRRQAPAGTLAPQRMGRPPGGGQLAGFEAFLIQQVEKRPDITMPELAQWLLSEPGVRAAPATLSRLLCRHGLTYKKTPDGSRVRTR